MASQKDIIRYLEALREREINFREFIKILRSNGMPVAQGWNALIPKYQSLPANVDLEYYIKKLKSVYRNHYLYANRAIIVLKFDQGEVARLAEAVDEWVDTSSGFSATFPIPVDQSQLRFLSSDPVATRVLTYDNSNNKTLVSCSKRYVRSRECIDFSEFSDDARKTLAAYDEVFGVRSRYIQAFDTLMFDVEADLVILTVDLCGNLSLQDIGRSIIAHMKQFNQKLVALNIDLDALDVRINFFPKIEALYADPEGIIERVGHVTSSGSNKVERMRSRGKDLRTEPFHKQGLKAIDGGTDLFLISKRWTVNDYHIGATIPGHFSQAGNKDAVIDAAIVEGCRNRKDFHKVLDYLMK